MDASIPQVSTKHGQCQSKWICELLDVKCNAQTIPGENVSLPVYGDLSDLYHPFCHI